MNVLSLNCQRLGNPRTVRNLHRLVKEKKPDLVFLMETKMQNKKCDFIRIKLGFDYMFGVDSVGRSGGLLLLWKIDCNITFKIIAVVI
jgi:exonuclease III